MRSFSKLNSQLELPFSPTCSATDSTCRTGWKTTDGIWLEPMVQNTKKTKADSHSKTTRHCPTAIGLVCPRLKRDFCHHLLTHNIITNLYDFFFYLLNIKEDHLGKKSIIVHAVNVWDPSNLYCIIDKNIFCVPLEKVCHTGLEWGCVNMTEFLFLGERSLEVTSWMECMISTWWWWEV